MTKAKTIADHQNMPWSHIGNAELDAAAERLFNHLRADTDGPYHVQPSAVQERAQRAVLDLLGTAVPTLLRTTAKERTKEGDKVTAALLREIAGEIEESHR